MIHNSAEEAAYIQQELSSAAPKAVALFAILAADRAVACMWPLSLLTRDFSRAANVVDELYASFWTPVDLAAASSTAEHILGILEKEEFDSTLLGAQGREAASALAYAVQTCLRPSAETAAFASMSAYEVVDCYVEYMREQFEEVSDEDTLDLYARERTAARSDLQFCAHAKLLSRKIIVVRRMKNAQLRIPPAVS